MKLHSVCLCVCVCVCVCVCACARVCERERGGRGDGQNFKKDMIEGFIMKSKNPLVYLFLHPVILFRNNCFF